MWPLVRAGCPTARFRILGNAAAKHLSDLIGEPGVELCEPGDEIAAELGRATVVAVPIRAGSGTRVKILEALAAGKPVVTTTIGCEGLDVTPERDVIVCDEPAQFAARIVELLNNELLRYALSVNGRRLIEQRYNWTMAVDRLEAFCVHVAQHSQERIAAGSP
jgi:glycosyltransferase involved in cell wall biosynthesis